MVGTFFEEARPGELKANLIIMWREDNIIEEIVEDSNIEDAIKTVLRKRRRKCSFAGRRILADVPKAVERIRQRIRSGRFKLGGYREMTVDDGPKVRIVQSVSLEDRIVLNAVMNVVDRHLKVRFIRTTSASIKNRGTHDLLQYIVKDIKDDPEGTLFGYQFDITKFYESVDQDVLLDAVKKMFKDKILIGILEECIRMMPKGVSIGLRSSPRPWSCQGFPLPDGAAPVRPFRRYTCRGGVVPDQVLPELQYRAPNILLWRQLRNFQTNRSCFPLMFFLCPEAASGRYFRNHLAKTYRNKRKNTRKISNS